MSKVTLNVIKPWIAQKIQAILGFEDEIIANLIGSLLEAEQVISLYHHAEVASCLC